MLKCSIYNSGQISYKPEIWTVYRLIYENTNVKHVARTINQERACYHVSIRPAQVHYNPDICLFNYRVNMKSILINAHRNENFHKPYKHFQKYITSLDLFQSNLKHVFHAYPFIKETSKQSGLLCFIPAVVFLKDLYGLKCYKY